MILSVGRSANTGNANNSRNVNSTGGNDNNNAINGNYFTPDSIIDCLELSMEK